MVTSLRDRTGLATLTRHASPPTADVPDVPDVPDVESVPVGALSLREQRETALLARALHEQHPDVPLAVMTSIVEHEYAELATSRVQAFRMILTGRAVRRRLSSADAGSKGPIDRSEQR